MVRPDLREAVGLENREDGWKSKRKFNAGRTSHLGTETATSHYSELSAKPDFVPICANSLSMLSFWSFSTFEKSATYVFSIGLGVRFRPAPPYSFDNRCLWCS